MQKQTSFQATLGAALLATIGITPARAQLEQTAAPAAESAEAVEQAVPQTAADAVAPEAQPEDGDAAAASADSAGSLDVEEIVVTAQRRSEPLQDTPISVQAISQDELLDRNVQVVADLQKISPSLTVQSVSGAVSPFIRGVGSTVQGPGTSGSVAVYADGLYLPTTYEGSAYLDDVEQLQVLSGPQGALYGRNATGGAIVISTPTPKPGDPLSGRIRVANGNYDLRSYQASVSGSLSETMAGYFSASSDKHDGYIENLNPRGAGQHNDDLDDRDSWSTRAAFVYQPTDRFSMVLRGNYGIQDDRGGYGYQIVGTDLDVGGGFNGTQAYYAGILQAFGTAPADAANAAGGLQFPTKVGQTYDGVINGFQNGTLNGHYKPGSFHYLSAGATSVKLAYRFDTFELSSLTGYSASDAGSAAEIIVANPNTLYSPAPGSVPATAVGFSGRFPTHTIQQDFQITSIDSTIEWLAGAFLFKSQGQSEISADLPFGLSFLTVDADWSVSSMAAYAQAKIPIADQWDVSLGGRYTEETYELDDHIDPSNPQVLAGVSNHGHREIDSSKFTYTARLEYDSGPLLIYGGVITGFKSGMLSASNPGSPPVTPESITSFETGFKWTASSVLTINGAAFYYDYKNIHISTVDSTSGVTVFVNGPGAEIVGAELEARLRATPWWTLRGSAMVLDGEYDADVPPSGSLGVIHTNGKNLSGAPDHVLVLGTDVIAPQITKGDLKLSIDTTFSSGFYLDPENLTGTDGIEASAFTLVDATLSYAPADGPWKIAAYGANLTDEGYYRSGTVAGGILRVAVAAPPRTFGVRIEYRF